MQFLLSTALSLALVFTSLNCLCALPESSQPTPDMHASHHGHGMTTEQDQGKPGCHQEACLNDCSDIRILPTSPESYQMMGRVDTEDDDSGGVIPTSHHPVISLNATGPPPATVLFTTSTPVNRYDTLLE